MAFTATLVKRSVHGDEAVVHYTVTADAASGSVNTGLGNIVNYSLTPSSLNSANHKTYKNALGGATAAAGYVGFDGCTSGDTWYLVVFGR